MTSSPELPVPDAALRRHDEPARPNLTDDALRARLARIAAPIVAAVLREEAADTRESGALRGDEGESEQADIFYRLADRLDERADQLDQS